MTAKAAALMQPGKGMLVLDDYAQAAVDRASHAGLSFQRYIELVIDSTSLAPFLSAVVVAPDALPDVEKSAPEIGLGVRMPVPTGGYSPTHPHVNIAEWRANLSPAQVARGSTHTDAEALATGAATSLAGGITPVLTIAMPDLGTHSQGVTHAATANALSALSTAVSRLAIDPAAVLLRVNMITPGIDHGSRPTPDEIASSTLRVLDESISADVAGVLLLSGGQSLDEACENLRAIVSLARERSVPWPITFGFTRALVNASLEGTAPHDDLAHACERAAQSVSGAVDTEPLLAR